MILPLTPPNLSSYFKAKIAQTESRDASLLAIYAEVQPILSKGNVNIIVEI